MVCFIDLLGFAGSFLEIITTYFESKKEPSMEPSSTSLFLAPHEQRLGVIPKETTRPILMRSTV